MGEVYRAHDRRLGRDVAIKVLPSAFSDDPDRLARFEREARVLASLNHPHIAAIYGVEEANRTTGTAQTLVALVLELVEGPTLAERLTQEPMPVGEVLVLARQLAEALEAAHEKGIVHRDLKPANIKLTRDGAVKVLDFGLAKAFDTSADGAESPTLTAVGTRAGVILGTAAYMSPEQARGQTVDKRTDIWAFGCVLFEMLTGQRAFPGATVSDTIAAVIHKEPAWDAIPSHAPPVLVSVLRRCLQKSAAQRIRDAGDIRLALEGAFDAGQARRPAPWRPTMLWVAASLVLTAVAAGVTGWQLKPSGTRPVSRFSHIPPPDQSFVGQRSHSLVAIAPDGSSIVYVTSNRLYRRAIDEMNAVPIRGSEGTPLAPFFSPDGQSVGYWDAAANQLRRIAIAGGTSVTVAGATTLYGASWGADDTIVYGQPDGIWRVSANGGTPEHLVQIEPAEFAYGPQTLPDGKAVLFSLVTGGSMIGQSTAWDSAQVVAQSLDTGERKAIIGGGDARFVPTGHLVYALDRTLFAVPFDPVRRVARGGPVPVLENIQRTVRGSGGQGGGANYDFSHRGTLVYVPAGPTGFELRRRLLAVDQEGQPVPLIDDERNYWRPRISPDGTRLAVEVLESNQGTHIWIVNLKSRTATPLTAQGESAYPVWTSDSQSVIYRSNRGGIQGTYRQRADGSDAPELLYAMAAVPTDVSPDGTVALYSVNPQDIHTFRLEDKSPSEFLATPALEHMPMFSPDGKWLAYTSNESGKNEVWVRRYPRTPGVARLVSPDGGAGPVWSPDGSTLYYRGASGELMAVPTTLDPTFNAGRPRPLFRYAGIFRMSGTAAAYDIHPDGKRFIMVSEPDEPIAQGPDQIHIVLNWFDELKRLAPGR